MRIFLISICISVLFLNCSQKIICEITGNIQTSENEIIDTIQIGQMAQISPRDYVSGIIGETTVNNKGEFKYILKKQKFNVDKNFHIYFVKDGYEKVVRTINIYDNKKIILDTVFLMKKTE